ncbi:MULTISPECIES: hypothetical protein [Roseobacteraceae]|jgi:hypothetical protein|uniref:Uncharacterized protein n=1 Tax=Celeribacter baekdonensis TaxID=875171 RepID=A0A1G7T6S6_9RHOB|nr:MULTISPECIES: hypothetical protein [Roseobacteraceae]MBU0643128.1 hypothetical protein [Alphaproteobacteria bacterium]AVW90054.1 hypothetical protein DA792_02355 [Celeribacter baekdonensis]KAB6717161.1 hypothetical protein C8029_05805 [Roseobacter sp. TSBP12]MBU1280060.1 hypothetical protein [Alphaproteobacteria bacterium]MBU1830394.1 hypothetical protein [Alphaproteobacteria bacterium]|tara:strand:+ start:31341 stop:31640 length:300 start_codon:yes stop_codon:yes gene_type:complete
MSKFEKMTPQTNTLDASVDDVLRALRAPDGDGLSLTQMQSLLAGLIRVYAGLRESDKDLAAFPNDSDVSATEVAIATTGLLEAADMAAFELGMWQTLKN